MSARAGLREFNPNLGVTRLDCHVNGHTTGQFHLDPDDRPQGLQPLT